MPLVDIVMTTKGSNDADRRTLFYRTLMSFFGNTDRSLYRFTLVHDGSENEKLSIQDNDIDYVLTNRCNEGLGPSLNKATAHIKATNDWYEASGQLKKDTNGVSEYICYIQDDILFTPKWLETLIQRFVLFEKQYNLGFASGIECIEHATKKVLPGGMLLKDWVRATCMFARREYWQSMFPIPRFDPETGRLRAKPNDGMGSGVDWHLIRNHENSVCRTGKTCLVIPGLLVHSGYDKSTWLKRELPESDTDKKLMKELQK